MQTNSKFKYSLKVLFLSFNIKVEKQKDLNWDFNWVFRIFKGVHH